MKQPRLIDPRNMFYDHKFPDQEQETPAIQNDMTPEPDCGEATYQGHELLTDRTALITGGDSGIGRAVAIAYAREGADVAIQYFPGEEEDIKEVEKIVTEAGRACLLIPKDLRDANAASEIVQQTLEHFGQLDLLVLNAAQQIAFESLQDLSMQQVEETFKVNIISMFESVKSAEPHLPAGASIILTTSVQATDPSPSLMDYAATKGAISNLVKSLAKYFADKGIRVNGVAPGPIWTPLQLDQGQLPGKIPEFGQHSLLGRAGQPVELSHVYVYLASNQASYVTSQIYGITGGQAIH